MKLVISLTVALLVGACATTVPTPDVPPEPVVITKEVERIVQIRCPDQRGPTPVFPDTDEKLALFADDDIFGLSQAFRAGRDLRDARLATDDIQIKGCTGGM